MLAVPRTICTRAGAFARRTPLEFRGKLVAGLPGLPQFQAALFGERPMNCARLIEASPFYALFPKGMIPIVNILVPSRVELEGTPETEAYMVDMTLLTPEQFHGIADRLAQASGVDVWEVRREMLLRGLPLRVSQVEAVVTNELWFL